MEALLISRPIDLILLAEGLRGIKKYLQVNVTLRENCCCPQNPKNVLFTKSPDLSRVTT